MGTYIYTQVSSECENLLHAHIQNKLSILSLSHLSPPICCSSKFSQRPKSSSVRLFTEVWIDPPQAFIVRRKSSSATRPAQNTSLKMNERVSLKTKFHSDLKAIP